jgi:hypothetical protein
MDEKNWREVLGIPSMSSLEEENHYYYDPSDAKGHAGDPEVGAVWEASAPRLPVRLILPSLSEVGQSSLPTPSPPPEIAGIDLT